MSHFTSDFYNIHWRPRIPVFDVQHPCVPYLMSPSPSSRILESQVPTHASQYPSPTFIHSPEWPLTHMSTDLRESFSQGFVEKASICGCCWVHNLFLLTCKGGKHICRWSVSCSSSLPGLANWLLPRKACIEHSYFHVHCLVHEFRFLKSGFTKKLAYLGPVSHNKCMQESETFFWIFYLLFEMQIHKTWQSRSFATVICASIFDLL